MIGGHFVDNSAFIHSNYDDSQEIYLTENAMRK